MIRSFQKILLMKLLYINVGNSVLSYFRGYLILWVHI